MSGGTLARDRSAQLRRDNRVLLAKLGVIVVAMFGFGYALVPFYEKICEVTG
jgi:cytochrome c oxidase assembly protein subunit 11